MQFDNESNSSSEESEGCAPLTVPPTVETFSITQEDATILAEHLEEFENGDADVRTTIVANVMAELWLLRPETLPFDKIEASKVLVHIT
jgi:hypothetical protein